MDQPRWYASALACLVLACGGAPEGGPPGARHPSTEQDYLLLLERFPLKSMGSGVDPLLPPGQVADHLEVYALVLSSEARRWAATHDPGAASRVRTCVAHILATRDLDGDGKPGWGMPFAWDAFADGTVNPADWPYTISTAQMLEGLLDALDLAPSLFSGDDLAATERVVREVWARWVTEVWTSDGDRGWFWYSPAPSDSDDVVNVNGMMLSVAARALGHRWQVEDAAFLATVRATARTVTRTLLAEASYRSGLPFWTYIAVPNSRGSVVPNDAVHHVYVIWGLERARDLGLAEGGMPYDRESALGSLATFVRNQEVYDYPQDVTYTGDVASFNDRPASLWGLSASIAVLGEFGSISDPFLEEELRTLRTVYGPVPDLHNWPAGPNVDGQFYPRYAAHALWGLATVTYGAASELRPGR